VDRATLPSFIFQDPFRISGTFETRDLEILFTGALTKICKKYVIGGSRAWSRDTSKFWDLLCICITAQAINSHIDGRRP